MKQNNDCIDDYQLCSLCGNLSKIFHAEKYNTYYKCSVCLGIFKDKNELPNKKKEIERYKEHNNDINDIRYQKFVMPIVEAILTDFSENHKGLDFGAGTGPVISKLLKDNNYDIVQYDPYFHNNPKLLEQKYDYIAACEVVEHFYNPAKDFELLRNILNERGKLYCKTKIYKPSINFDNWYYKNDPTHVFFYQKETLHYLCREFEFSGVDITANLIVFYI
jgi:hypothetical protein